MNLEDKSTVEMIELYEHLTNDIDSLEKRLNDLKKIKARVWTHLVAPINNRSYANGNGRGLVTGHYIMRGERVRLIVANGKIVWERPDYISPDDIGDGS